MKHRSTLHILAAGELLWDILPEMRRCGGAPGNIIYHARKQGANAHIFSALGNDGDGDELRRVLKQRGIPDQFLTTNSAPTGKVTVTLQHGIPEYVIHAPAAWDQLEITARVREFAERADAFCFGTLAQRSSQSRAAIQELARRTPPDALRVFDINLRQEFYSPQLLQESLELANVLKLSDEELPILRQIFALAEDDLPALRQLRERFQLKFILFTLGKNGSIYMDANETLRQAIVDFGPVADTVGCGDSFLATFLVEYLSGTPCAGSLLRASTISGMVAARNGAMPDDPEFLAISSQKYSQAPSGSI